VLDRYPDTNTDGYSLADVDEHTATDRHADT
jgi:hypothetical protein